MIELGEYMLHVKNKRMVQLNVSFSVASKATFLNIYALSLVKLCNQYSHHIHVLSLGRNRNI